MTTTVGSDFRATNRLQISNGLDSTGSDFEWTILSGQITLHFVTSHNILASRRFLLKRFSWQRDLTIELGWPAFLTNYKFNRLTPLDTIWISDGFTRNSRLQLLRADFEETVLKN